MIVTRASWSMLMLQLTVSVLLLARQGACRKLESDASDEWPSIFSRTLLQDYAVENDGVEIQQRDSSAICQLPNPSNPSLTAQCNSNCRVCTFNPNVAPNFRTCRCCRPGFFSTSYTTPGTLCSACAKGTFQAASGATTCRPCPRQTTNLGSDRKTCAACPPGRFSVPTTTSSGAPATRCNKCPVNQVSPGGAFADVTSCSRCPTGTTSNSARTNCTAQNGFPNNARCANVAGASGGSGFVCATGFNITRPSNSIVGQTFAAAFTTCCKEDTTIAFPITATCGDIDAGAATTPFTCGTSYAGPSQGVIGGLSPQGALGVCCTVKSG